MGLFDKIFKGQETIKKEEINGVPWIELKDIDSLEEIVKNSFVTPVAIFKHSTRCGISNMILKQFEKEFKVEEGKIQLYFLDLLSHREISNKVASKFNVPHQSPQLLIVKDGKIVYDGSHSEIKAETLHNYI